MRNLLKTISLILIFAGTLGLLFNEFVWDHSRTQTIIFAVVDLFGLVSLAYAHFGLKDE